MTFIKDIWYWLLQKRRGHSMVFIFQEILFQFPLWGAFKKRCSSPTLLLMHNYRNEYKHEFFCTLPDYSWYLSLLSRSLNTAVKKLNTLNSSHLRNVNKKHPPNHHISTRMIPQLACAYGTCYDVYQMKYLEDILSHFLLFLFLVFIFRQDINE